MQVGDISVFTTQAGDKHPAVVTATHDDGSVDLSVLKTTHRAVKCSAEMDLGTFFDPTLPVEAPAPGKLASVPVGPGDVLDEGSDPDADKQGQDDGREQLPDQRPAE
jgi:hypothetical protein